jgi:ribose 5-phosphate isomerase B
MEVSMERVAIGSDHAGYALKSFFVAEFGRRGIGIVDVGTDSSNPVDYVPFCIALAGVITSSRRFRSAHR